MSAAAQEQVALASNFQVEISNIGTLEHVLSHSGGGITLPQLQAQGGDDPYTSHASGRPCADPVTITMLLTNKNKQVITNASKFLQNTQGTPRVDITLTLLNRDLSPGHRTVYHDCFLTMIEHPKCQNTDGVLTVTTTWQPIRVDNG